YGPSPRTWGERDRHRHSGAELRTIPTHVGRTPKRSPAGCIASDHPHARGENAKTGLAPNTGVGPSPRTWGELTSSPLLPPALRTIPTHVGRTVKRDASQSVSADHPHARGENLGSQASQFEGGGPSPRTWGELADPAGIAPRFRTIPTHVGRTHQFDCLVRQWNGPSPRTWGERDRHRHS